MRRSLSLFSRRYADALRDIQSGAILDLDALSSLSDSPDIPTVFQDLMLATNRTLSEYYKGRCIDLYASKITKANSDDNDISNKFHEFFVRVFQTHRQAIPPFFLLQQGIKTALRLDFPSYAEALFHRLCDFLQDATVSSRSQHTLSDYGPLLESIVQTLNPPNENDRMTKIWGVVKAAKSVGIPLSINTASMVIAQAEKTKDIDVFLKTVDEVECGETFLRTKSFLLEDETYNTTVLGGLREFLVLYSEEIEGNMDIWRLVDKEVLGSDLVIKKITKLSEERLKTYKEIKNRVTNTEKSTLNHLKIFLECSIRLRDKKTALELISTIQSKLTGDNGTLDQQTKWKYNLKKILISSDDLISSILTTKNIKNDDIPSLLEEIPRLKKHFDMVSLEPGQCNEHHFEEYESLFSLLELDIWCMRMKLFSFSSNSSECSNEENIEMIFNSISSRVKLAHQVWSLFGGFQNLPQDTYLLQTRHMRLLQVYSAAGDIHHFESILSCTRNLPTATHILRLICYSSARILSEKGYVLSEGRYSKVENMVVPPITNTVPYYFSDIYYSELLKQYGTALSTTAFAASRKQRISFKKPQGILHNDSKPLNGYSNNNHSFFDKSVSNNNTNPLGGTKATKVVDGSQVSDQSETQKKGHAPSGMYMNAMRVRSDGNPLASKQWRTSY